MGTTVQAMNSLACTVWLEQVMSKIWDVVSMQTLRYATMTKMACVPIYFSAPVLLWMVSSIRILIAIFRLLAVLKHLDHLLSRAEG